MDTAGYHTNLIFFFGSFIIRVTNTFAGFRHLYESFLIYLEILKLDPYQYQRTHGLDADGYAPEYYSTEPHYQYQQRHTHFLFWFVIVSLEYY
jgi:hypothetical protein